MQKRKTKNGKYSKYIKIEFSLCLITFVCVHQCVFRLHWRLETDRKREREQSYVVLVIQLHVKMRLPIFYLFTMARFWNSIQKWAFCVSEIRSDRSHRSSSSSSIAQYIRVNRYSKISSSPKFSHFNHTLYQEIRSNSYATQLWQRHSCTVRCVDICMWRSFDSHWLPRLGHTYFHHKTKKNRLVL